MTLSYIYLLELIKELYSELLLIKFQDHFRMSDSDVLAKEKLDALDIMLKEQMP